MRDVVIIGAGVSGLTAAWRLQEAGLDVLVLEARARIGGRTWSPEMAGACFDLGATWVWDHEASVHALLKTLNIETFDGHADLKDLYEADGGGIQKTSLPRSWSPERRIVGGAERIAAALAARVNSVMLGQAVRTIVPHGDHLQVDLDGQSFKAKYVIAALPPALLGDSIRLVGIADSTLEVFRRTPVWMGDIAKVVAVYEHSFWRKSGLSGRVFSHIGPMMEIHELSGHEDEAGAALFGFFPKPQSQSVDLEAQARAQLIRLFGEEAASPIALRVHAWWDDRETVPLRPLRPHPPLLGHEALRRPHYGGRFHLASTETAAVNAGHIDGAVSRAMEVTDRIIHAA